jgi:N-acetylneuraminate synthase
MNNLAPKFNEFICIENRRIGREYPPFIIAEVGINHEGSLEKALQMVEAAKEAGADCVKFQCHIIEDEMIPSDVYPGNSPDKIWDIIKRCQLSAEQELEIQRYCGKLDIIYLSTPFSRAAANRLHAMNVPAFKIGSGECNNYPLIKHITSFGKPIILSTGMNNFESIDKAVKIIKGKGCPLVLLHCTSMYPTPYENVRLGAIAELRDVYDVPVGLSDHSLGIYTALGSVALGACVLEKHFTISKDWPGPDIPISIDPIELYELVKGANAIWKSGGNGKEILPGEGPVINFAYATVVSIKAIAKGEQFTEENIWVKRPGTGEISAEKYESLLGRTAQCDIPTNTHIKLSDVT